MIAPPSYVEKVFSVAEAAQITRIPESTIRSWLHKTVSFIFARRKGSRVLFSTRDLVTLRLASELVDCAFPPVVAMTTAWRMTGELSPRPIPEGQVYMTDPIRIDAQGDEWGYWGEIEEPKRTRIVVPIGSIYASITAAAEALATRPRR